MSGINLCVFGIKMWISSCLEFSSTAEVMNSQNSNGIKM